MKVISYVVGVIVVAMACMLGWDLYASAKNQREALRVDGLFTHISNRLDAQKQAAGQYPDSLAALAVTNPDDVADMRKIVYRRTESGYSLSYAVSGGYRKTSVFSDTTSHH